MTKNHHRHRITALQEYLVETDLLAVALNPGPDLTYFSGLDFHLMERPVIMILPREGSPVMILPELESGKLDDLPFAADHFLFNEDPGTWTDVFKEALNAAEIQAGKLGVIPRRMRMLELSYLQAAGTDLELVSAQDSISKMRIIKDDSEIQAMAEAVRIAECALAAILPSIQSGRSEKEIAARLVGRLLQEGSDPQLPFFPIISFGENSANPHASPTERLLKEGDLILIDWGAAHNGYFSDITRVFALGDLNPELEKIAQFVEEANQAARQAVKPGVPASAVDKEARQVISKVGYGDCFIHRTGHGLGREPHEEPYISEFDQTILEPGMTFTIEPGIYLPGKGGVRIEDNIVVTEDGCQSLTKRTRDLTQLLPDDPYL